MKQLLFLLLIAATVARPGTTGKISGKIIDGATRQPLPSVNVVIVGTSMGATSDVEGNFFILNIPVGTYSLRASMVGYGARSISNVKVMADITTTIDFVMEAEDIAMRDVVVTAERPAIQQDKTSTRHIVDEEVLNALPVDDFREVVQMQAGVVGSHFRGGRFNEALFLIDGLPVKSAVNGYTGYTGGFSTNIPQLSVSEIQVSTGGFEAEYGNAQSGVVNTITRDAGRLSAKLRLRTSDFPWEKMEWRPNAYGKGQPNWKNAEGFLNTPSLMLGDYRIALNGSADISWTTKDFLPHDNSFRESYQGKLSIQAPSTRITVSGLRSWATSNSYYHTYSKFGPLSEGYQTDRFEQWTTISGKRTLEQYLYVTNPEKYPKVQMDSVYVDSLSTWYPVRRMYQAGMQNRISVPVNQSYNIGFLWTQTLNNQSFIDVKVSQFWTRFREVVRDADDRDADGNTTEELFWGENGNIGGYTSRLSTEGYWSYTGDEGWYLDQVSTTTSVRADYSNQINSSNLLKTGIEGSYIEGDVEKVTFESVSNPRFDLWKQDLVDFGFYVQDKIEVRNGFILNAGIRFDYYDPNGLTTDMLYPNDPTTLPDHKDGQGLTSSDRVLSRWQISPRIGISHPITEKDKIHFYYGHFFQRPDLRYLYENVSLNFRFTTNVDLGNPRLLPEKTVSYELGWDHLFSDFLRMTTTLYFKDITNLVGATDYVISGSPDSYQAYTNMDYANVRGVEVTLEAIATHGIGGMVNVSYAFANGRSSSVFRSNGEIVPRRLDPLEWDVRWKINANLLFSSKGVVEEYIGDAEMNFVVSASSGAPYTRNTRDVFPLFALRNDGRLPWRSNVDMRARKGFTLGDIELSLLAEVKNLFDTRNVDFIAGGRDGIAEFETSGDPTGPYFNPTAYSQPRMYRLGLQVQF